VGTIFLYLMTGGGGETQKGEVSSDDSMTGCGEVESRRAFSHERVRILLKCPVAITTDSDFTAFPLLCPPASSSALPLLCRSTCLSHRLVLKWPSSFLFFVSLFQSPPPPPSHTQNPPRLFHSRIRFWQTDQMVSVTGGQEKR